LEKDYLSASDKILSFYNNILKSNSLVDKNIDYNNIDLIVDDAVFDTNFEKMLYVCLSKLLLNQNDKTKFINDLIQKMNIEEAFRSQVQTRIDDWFSEILKFWKQEKDAEKKFFEEKVLNNPTYMSEFKTWTPFVKGKTRKFTFSDQGQASNDDKSRLRNIYKNGNSNTDSKVFNGKNKFN